MKFTLFEKIIDETSITLKENRAVVIDRLMQQSGICRNDSTYGSKIYFQCKKNGEFWLDSISSGRHANRNFCYYIKGKVLEENGKTVVKIYSIYNKAWLAVTYITLIIAAIYYIGSLMLMSYVKFGISTKLVMVCLPLVVVFVAIFSQLQKARNNQNADFAIMKQEVINRVEAVKLWDK